MHNLHVHHSRLHWTWEPMTLMFMHKNLFGIANICCFHALWPPLLVTYLRSWLWQYLPIDSAIFHRVVRHAGNWWGSWWILVNSTPALLSPRIHIQSCIRNSGYIACYHAIQLTFKRVKYISRKVTHSDPTTPGISLLTWINHTWLNWESCSHWYTIFLSTQLCTVINL